RVRTGLGAAAVELVLADDDGVTVHRVGPGDPYRRWRSTLDGVYAPLLEADDVLLFPPDPLVPGLEAWLKGLGHRNVLTAPWRRQGGPRGVLCVFDRTGLRGFGANLRQVSEVLARELAGALARADLLRRVDSERARFAALVRGSSDLVLVVDPYGTVRYASEAAHQVVARRADELIGRPLSALFAAHQSDAIRSWITCTAADPAATVPFVLELPMPGRLPRQIEAISRNLLADVAVGGIVVNARDVTESRRGQALLQRQAEVLELIAADAPLWETLQLVAATVEELLPATHCAVRVGMQPADADWPPDTGPGGAAKDRYGALAQALGDTPWQHADGAGREPSGPVVLADVATDDGLPRPLQRRLLDVGIGACWVWPLVLHGDQHADTSLTVFFEGERRPLPSERGLMDLAAQLAANAIGRTQERQRLAYQATHDALTGLASRAVLRNHVELALARMRRSETAVAVLFVDLDNFKIINDSLGHHVGDSLLQEISRRLLALVRPEDTVARLGGDEFVVLCGDMPGADEADAVAHRLLTLLAEAVRVDGHEFFVTASLGIALASGSEHSPDLLVENADAAMYRAKAKGGNRYEVFDETMRTAAARRLSMRTSLRRALHRPDIRVFYQPTVDLVSGRLRGVEALVRWQHPSRGLLPPSEFIPLAEETGLIVPLGAHVLVESCRQVAQWRAQHGNAPLELSVNLSPRQFASGDLVDVVERALGEAGLEAASLVLEITETCLMEDAVDIRHALESLKKVGVQLAIDDFGTGYSSLAYLRNLPVDTLKLDQSFVRHVDQDGPDRAIAEMVMGLGRTLGLRTVAEGIETTPQLQTMQSLRCDVGQGFLLGRPVPPEQLDPREMTRGVVDQQAPPLALDVPS
ncbi:MAG: hypothetical protein QOC98_2722, partial [Frankiaceae bacterium]|nr:hypothetical protein [Frankiaceae bacterium]